MVTILHTEWSRGWDGQEIENGVYNDIKRKKRFKNSFHAFQQVEKQKEGIKKLLKKGKQDLALRFTKELIVSQRHNGGPKHIAKSLCDLAQFAKGLGNQELQLEFASMAVTEAPGDAWSYATLGDAFRSLTEFQQSLDMYHTAEVLGNVCVALCGRAEVLKDLGKIEESLQIYEQCIREFPTDLVPRNGWASCLGV